jgi:hypothetical protein
LYHGGVGFAAGMNLCHTANVAVEVVFVLPLHQNKRKCAGKEQVNEFARPCGEAIM